MAEAAVIGGGALLGGIAGGEGSKQLQTRRVALEPEGELERLARLLQERTLPQLESLVRAGPGQADVTAAQDRSRSLLDAFDQFISQGGLPGQTQTIQAQNFARDIFAGRRTALEQGIQQEGVRTNRLAAQLNRNINDPVLQTQLAESANLARERLGAEQGSFAANLALQIPQQTLGLQQQAAGLQSQLATQALANRQALLGLGRQLQLGQQQFRFQTAEQNAIARTPGSFGGFLTGALSGASAGSSAFTGFGG